MNYLLMLITAASLATMQSTDRTILRTALKSDLGEPVKGSTAVFAWTPIVTATGTVYVTCFHAGQFDATITNTLASTGVVAALDRAGIEVLWTDSPSGELEARGVVPQNAGRL